jgi:hypothetical protein
VQDHRDSVSVCATSRARCMCGRDFVRKPRAFNWAMPPQVVRQLGGYKRPARLNQPRAIAYHHVRAGGACWTTTLSRTGLTLLNNDVGRPKVLLRRQHNFDETNISAIVRPHHPRSNPMLRTPSVRIFPDGAETAVEAIEMHTVMALVSWSCVFYKTPAPYVR